MSEQTSFSSKTVDFLATATTFLRLILDIPSVGVVHQIFPNCYGKVIGDKLVVFNVTDRTTHARASYALGTILVHENHGPQVHESQRGPGDSGSHPVQTIRPAIPDAENTQVIPVTHPENMRPTPRPAVNVADLERQHEENMRVVSMGKKDRDQDFEKAQDAEIAKLRPHVTTHTVTQVPQNEPKELPPASPDQSNSVAHETSAWSAAKSIIFGKNDDGSFEFRRKSQSGIGLHRWTGGTHRRPAWTKRAVVWSRKQLAYNVLAFRVYVTPVVIEPSR